MRDFLNIQDPASILPVFLFSSIPVDTSNRDTMLNIINSSITTKVISRWSSLACNIALDAVKTVQFEENGRKEIDIKKYARVEKVNSSSVYVGNKLFPSITFVEEVKFKSEQDTFIIRIRKKSICYLENKNLEKEGTKEVSEITLLASLLSLPMVYRGKGKAFYFIFLSSVFVCISDTRSGNKGSTP